MIKGVGVALVLFVSMLQNVTQMYRDSNILFG